MYPYALLWLSLIVHYDDKQDGIPILALDREQQ